MKIGVISDTHNYLDPKVLRLFKGVGHIFHAGDIGLPWLIQELENIAPVAAVLGNTDAELGIFQETEVLDLAGRKFLLRHAVDVHSPDSLLQRQLAKENPDVVIFGHTHKPFCQTIDGRLYFNPGYAGKRRFTLPRSVAILECDAQGVRAEYKSLEE